MNAHDKANLEFILSASKKTLQEWYDSLSEDDLAYAQELLDKASLELAMLIVELYDDVPDVDLAKNVLDKYMLK
jgi:hypothetical protein